MGSHDVPPVAEKVLLMKALIFTSLYPNNVSPQLGIFIKERMTHFARLKNCQAKVVAPVPYYPPIKLGSRWKFSQVARYEVRDGLDVYHPRYFMTPKIGMSLYGVAMFLSVLPTVRRIQRSFDFDVIDSHFVYPDGFAAVLLGKVLRKPVVVSARGTDMNLYPNMPLIRSMLRFTLTRAHRAIAVCEALGAAISQLGIGKDKIVVIPNGVDTEKFKPIPKQEARAKLNLPAAAKVVLSVGGLIPRKGVDLVIKAVKTIRDSSGLDLHYVIVGEGSYRRELELLTSSLGLADCVHFCGEVAHYQLHVWYSAADIFCLASSREGWPNVILESMACGTPVVATNVWGNPEIIQSDQVGLLTERNEHLIARTLLKGLNTEWEAATIREYACQHTWDRAAQSVLDVFRIAVEDTSR